MESQVHNPGGHLQHDQRIDVQTTIPQQVSQEGHMEEPMNLSHRSFSTPLGMPPLVTLGSIAVSSSRSPLTSMAGQPLPLYTTSQQPSRVVQSDSYRGHLDTSPEPLVIASQQTDPAPEQPKTGTEEMDTTESPVPPANKSIINALEATKKSDWDRTTRVSASPSPLLMTRTMASENVSSRGSVLPQTVQAINQATSSPTRSPLPGKLTFPAGYMVIPTAHLQNMRMAAQDGQRFVQVIPAPGMQKLSDAQVAQLASKQVQGARLGTPDSSPGGGPRPTLLYSPNHYSQPHSTAKNSRVKGEESLAMMSTANRQNDSKDLIDDEQKAGQALVQLANSGKPQQAPPQTPEVVSDGSRTELIKREDVVRQNVSQALMDLSRGNRPNIPLLIGDKGTVQVPVFLPAHLTKAPEGVSFNSEPYAAGSSRPEKDPLRKILKKQSSAKSLIMGTAGNSESPVSSPPADVAAELNLFIKNYYHPDSSRKNQKQIPMKELRHVIPLLVLHCFDMKDHALHKKVKGLWVNPPTEWPETVPFCDPNNSKQKGELVGKPKKDTLVRMFHFLIKKYWEKNGTSGQVFDDYIEPVQESMVATEHGYTRNHTPSPVSPGKSGTPPTLLPSDQGLNRRSPNTPTAGNQTQANQTQNNQTQANQTPINQGSVNQTPSNQGLSNQIIRADTAGAINLTVPKSMEEEDKIPAETEEEELHCVDYDEDYDPIKETMSRLISKITMLKERKLIPDQHLGLLLIIHDLLNKMRSMIQDNLAKRFFIEKANEFEATVDIAKLEKSIPKAHREKWHDFEDEMKNDELDIHKFQAKLIEKRIGMDLVAKSTFFSEVSCKHNDDMVDLLAKLNIQPTGKKTIDEIMDYDCVEIRFMKNVDEKENLDDWTLSHKTTSNEDKLINQYIHVYENLEIGGTEECHTHPESANDIGYLDMLINSPKDSIDEDIDSIAGSEGSICTQSSDTNCKSYRNLKAARNQAGPKNPVESMVENAFYETTFNELAYSEPIKEAIIDIVTTSPPHQQNEEGFDLLSIEPSDMTNRPQNVLTEHIYAHGTEAGSFTAPEYIGKFDSGIINISQDKEMITSDLVHASMEICEMGSIIAASGNEILSENGQDMLTNDDHRGLSTNHRERLSSQSRYEVSCEDQVNTGPNVMTEQLKIENSIASHLFDSNELPETQIFSTPPFASYTTSPATTVPSEPHAPNALSPPPSQQEKKPVSKPPQPILRGLFGTTKAKPKRAARVYPEKTGGKGDKMECDNSICDVTNSQPLRDVSHGKVIQESPIEDKTECETIPTVVSALDSFNENEDPEERPKKRKRESQ